MALNITRGKAFADSIYEPKGYNIGYDRNEDSMFLIKYNGAKKVSRFNKNT
jgi:hypothetical protein